MYDHTRKIILSFAVNNSQVSESTVVHITRGDLLEAVVFFPFIYTTFYSRKPHPLRHSSEGKERKNDVRGVVYETTTFFDILLHEKFFFFTYLHVPTHSKFANVTRNNFFIVDGLNDGEHSAFSVVAHAQPTFIDLISFALRTGQGQLCTLALLWLTVSNYKLH